MRSGIGKAKTGNDFIKYQQCAVQRTQIAQALKEAGLRQQQAHISRHRLNKERGYLSGVIFKQRTHRIQIVVRSEKRVPHSAFRHARRARNGKGCQTGPRAGQKRIAMPVISADEFDHLVASGHAARKTQGAHGRFRA